MIFLKQLEDITWPRGDAKFLLECRNILFLNGFELSTPFLKLRYFSRSQLERMAKERHQANLAKKRYRTLKMGQIEKYPEVTDKQAQ